MSSLPPCDQCGSVEFEEIDGIVHCVNGHNQGHGQRTGEDDDDHHRKGRVARKKVERTRERAIRVYRGPRGYRLFLKAWQFILWKQCHELARELRLPDDIWTVVKELWTIRLEQLSDRIDDVTESRDQADPNKLMKKAKVGEAVSEGSENSTPHLIMNGPTLWDAIATNYLGILILRVPISMAVVYDLIRDESICFIRAIRHVPRDIRERLAPEYHEALDTTVIPQQHHLRKSIFRVVDMYSKAFGMTTPPLNWRPMLVSRINHLALPLEIYSATKYISNVANFDFTYQKPHESHRNVTSFPETQLMATLVVATKLLMPFPQDVDDFHPRTLMEPAALRMDWPAWFEGRKKPTKGNESIRQLQAKEAIETTDQDVMGMEESQLDRYMDWFQETYATKTKHGSNLNEQILDMFPLADVPTGTIQLTAEGPNIGQERANRLISSQSRLTSQHPIDDEGSQQQSETISRPGQKYQRFRHVHELSEIAGAFHKEAADMACLSLKELLRAVWRVERLVLLAQTGQRRADAFADDVISESE